MTNSNEAAIAEAKHLEAALPNIWRTDATHRHAIEGQNAAVNLCDEYLTWLKDHPNQREAVQAQLQKDHAQIDLGAQKIEFTHGKEDIECSISPDNQRIYSNVWHKEKPQKFLSF